MSSNFETAIVVAIIAFLASVLATVTNVIVAIISNRRLKAIEKEKRISELVTYRYTKLYSVLVDIESEHGFINYANDPSRTISESLDKRLKFVAFYKLTRPLLDAKYRAKLDNVANIENEEYKKVSVLIMSHNIDIEVLQNWSVAINKLLDSLNESIQNQLLTISNL